MHGHYRLRRKKRFKNKNDDQIIKNIDYIEPSRTHNTILIIWALAFNKIIFSRYLFAEYYFPQNSRFSGKAVRQVLPI